MIWASVGLVVRLGRLKTALGELLGPSIATLSLQAFAHFLFPGETTPDHVDFQVARC